MLSTDTNAVWFNRIANVAATTEFKEEFLHKLARGPHQLLRHRIRNTTNDCVELLKPLLDDLIRAESIGELRAVPNQPCEFVLAVKLDAQRAALWQSNIAFVLETWTGCQPEKLQTTQSKGWQLKKHHPPNLIRCEQLNSWIVLGCGQDNLPMFTQCAESIRKYGRPTFMQSNTDEHPVLDCLIDWPKLQSRLEGEFGFELPIHLPKMHITVTSSVEEILAKAELDLPEPLDWSAPPWCIPTNTIREPLISFTACRGISPLLQKLKLLTEIGLTPVPDQLYAWGLQDVPFQMFLAVPAQDTTNLIDRLRKVLQDRLVPTLQKRSLGNIELTTDGGTGLAWRGLPFIGPYVLSVSEPAGEFLLFGLLPNTPLSNPPPPELYAQFINRPEIAYYDWEMTHARFQQLWTLCQLVRLIAEKPQINTQSAMWKWLSSISTNLGNTATHLIVHNPQKLTIVRRAQLGLSAIELVAFANWFDSAEFPCCGLVLPARTVSDKVSSKNTNPNAQTRR